MLQRIGAAVLALTTRTGANAFQETRPSTSRARWPRRVPTARLRFGADLELTFRTRAAQGRNPNDAAEVVVGIEPNWTDRMVKEIAKTGKPCAGLGIERSEDFKTIEAASRTAKKLVHHAWEVRREPLPVSRHSPMCRVRTPRALENFPIHSPSCTIITSAPGLTRPRRRPGPQP